MISELKKYINKNAANIIRNRANSIYLDLKTRTDNHFVFSYQGSERRPYTIEVSTEGKNITSSCSCPYDFGGLCKHEVAAVNFVIDENSVELVGKDLFGNAIKKEQPNRIYLENHLLTKALVKSICKKNSIHYTQEYFVEITVIEADVVKTIYSDWHKILQEFRYNPETNTLTATCSCKDSKKKLCIHILSALSKIEEQFGEDFFHPHYIDLQKEAFLKGYGLSLTDNYQKYFDFSFGIQGLKVTEKIKNLAPSLKVAADNLLPQFNPQEADGLLVPKKANMTEFAYGIGFCFEFYKNAGNDYFKFFPFKAKYKKHSTAFVSSFKEIDPFYFMTQLKNIPESDHLLVIKALAFVEVYDHFLQKFSLESFREAFIQFNDMLDRTAAYPFFIKNEKDSLVKKNLSDLVFSEEHPILSFELAENEDVFSLKPKITIADKSYKLTSSKIKIFPFFCLYDRTIYRFKTPNEFVYINRLNMKNEINFLKNDYDNLYTKLLKPLSQHFEITSKVYKHSQNEIAEDQLKRQVYLSDFEGEFILFKLGVQYNDALVLLHTKEHLFDAKTQRIQPRNNTFETEFIEEFKDLHPDFQEQDGVFFLTPYQLMEDQWLLKASHKMEQKGITIFGAKELKSFKYNLNRPTVSMKVNAETDWFDLALDIKFGNQKVNLKDIKKAVLNKSKYVVLGDGTLGVLPKAWLQKFSTYFKAGEVKNNAIKISNYQFNIIDELYESMEITPAFLLELQRKKQQLLNLKNVADITIPKQLKATLRPYQKEGLNWLAFLHENQLGGCLADDMGLGKTLQVIAFLAFLKFVKKEKSTHLVVVPTSLIFNWENEVAKFCPSLKTLVYTGINRSEKLEDFEKSDIVLTTYGSILNDIETLAGITFGYTILDESQAIKNPNSKRYKAVRMLKSKNKLALTGTPIENNTFDLYAQMNFLNPGLLGAMSHFKNEFADAIDKAKSEETSQLLSKMIHPFLLRRTKKQVATELPEKTETIIYCEMGTEQRKIYNYFRDKYRDYLLHKIDEGGAAKSQMYVLEGLTKLRQICNSPELLNDAEDYGKSSVKLDVLIDHIKTKTTQHKVLVFSQFTSMLQLIKDRLDNENINYEYLDGKTHKREDKVSNFQDSDELRVFLISLKAGGVGLNLTAADYVFLVDPWWNPAVENQAIDRSYRIGQTKHVMAYRMICKDTIEEKIVDLQKSKKNVSDAIIQIDRSKKSFDAQEIQALFS